MSASAAIRIQGLKKSYGKVQALKGLDFALQPGQWCVLLGENGAGKSTLIQLLCGLFTPDAGYIEIDGVNLESQPTLALSRLGVVFQQPTLDLDLSVLDNLLYHAGLHGLPHSVSRERIEQGLQWSGLMEVIRRPVRSLSGGNRRRVELVRSLLHRPRVLLMDEATVGLDPASRQSLIEAVSRLVREQGLCVIWTTHWAREVTQADRLLILQKGQLQFDDTPARLLEQTGLDDIEQSFLQHIRATAPPTAPPESR